MAEKAIFIPLLYQESACLLINTVYGETKLNWTPLKFEVIITTNKMWLVFDMKGDFQFFNGFSWAAPLDSKRQRSH